MSSLVRSFPLSERQANLSKESEDGGDCPGVRESTQRSAAEGAKHVSNNEALCGGRRFGNVRAVAFIRKGSGS